VAAVHRIAPGWTTESAEAFAALVEPLSNWGRWGADDQLGTLNLLTPQAAAAACAAVVEGRSISLARPVVAAAAPDNPTPMLRLMRASGDAAADVGGSHASEWLGLGYHGFAVTHIDAHAHQFFGAQMFNGRPAALVSTRGGAAAGSVVPLAVAAPVGRGLLLDAPRAFGREWLQPGEGLGPAELDRVAEAQSSSPRSGDIVILRTGRDARAAVHGVLDPLVDGSAGLSAEALVWLRDNDIALLGSDVQADVMPPGGAPFAMPVHAGALVHLGLPLIDNLAVEALAAACARRGRWDFLAVVAPLPLDRCTGSPVAPVAVL
jgi:kynurenine formamidase